VLAQDPDLGTLWNAMAEGDEFLFGMARRAVLPSLTDPDVIAYRPHVLADCLGRINLHDRLTGKGRAGLLPGAAPGRPAHSHRAGDLRRLPDAAP